MNDNVLDSDTVRLIARVRRNERGPAPVAHGLPVDRVRQIAAEGRLTVDLNEQLALTGVVEADWTRRRLRAVAIDPRVHSNLAASASLGLAAPDGRWSVMASWHRNEATERPNEMVRAAALLGGAMRSGDGWSVSVSARPYDLSEMRPHLGVTVGSWAMGGREATMLGSMGSHRDQRVAISFSQRF